MNSLLRHARPLPIVSFVESIRSVIQRWFYEHQELVTVQKGYFTAQVQGEVDEQTELSHTMTMDLVMRFEFQVNDRGRVDIVDLWEKKCFYRLFEITQLPYAHAFAACKHVWLAINPICSPFYNIDALVHVYAKPINPVGDESNWMIPLELLERNIKPLWQRIPADQPIKQRISSQGEEIVMRRCSRCHAVGHNRATCRNLISLHEQVIVFVIVMYLFINVRLTQYFQLT